jgi:hypothetical protein
LFVGAIIGDDARKDKNKAVPSFSSAREEADGLEAVRDRRRTKHHEAQVHKKRGPKPS